MKYDDFKKKVLNRPIIFSKDIVPVGRSGQVVRNQLERWRKSGRIIRLKRGVFILAADDRKFETSRPYLANQLYGPSYVSLEYALNYYVTANSVVTMCRVVSIRISLLAVTLDDNLTPQPIPYTYYLNNVLQSITPTDRKIRRVFNTTIALRNHLP